MRTAFAVPASIDRLRGRALAVGAAGLLATVAGGLAAPDQFFRSYLFAFLFWVGVGVGCLSILMIHHQSGGMWGLAIRRILEAGSRVLMLAALAFLPLAFGLGRLFEWARPEEVARSAALQNKQAYLNVPFFLGRAAFYFAVWAALAHLLGRWSAALDAGADHGRVSGRLRSLSGGGLLLMGLTITFASVDWAMSLNPHWFSTVYGILFMVGMALSALALVIVVVAWLGRERPLLDVVTKETIHDLGKLLLAFVMLWAYISVSQFLIIWSGNLPEEIPWYLRRLHGGWQYLALGLVLFHFALPFLLLLSRELKRNARALGLLAVALLAMRLVDLYWLVAPDLGGHGGHGFAVHWMDLTAPLGLGGLWVAAFAGQLRSRPLVPLGEPEVRARLEAAGGAA
jgi:hypothetical protein